MPSALGRPAFPDDDGAADFRLVASLANGDGTEAWRRSTLRALATTRVFVPISAQLVNVDPERPIADDKHAEMALVTVTGRDGRRALPVFTGAAALLAWRPDLRPVPVEGARAARTAVDDGAVAVVVDLGQPSQFVVTGEDLDRLAAVWTAASAASGAGS
jgi:hypothetical protein